MVDRNFLGEFRRRFGGTMGDSSVHTFELRVQKLHSEVHATRRICSGIC
jgi:hypothetical protein